MSKKRRRSGRRRAFWEALILPHGRARRSAPRRALWEALIAPHDRGRHGRRLRHLRATMTLADIPAGTQVQVQSFRPMDPIRHQRLQAYGLCLGQRLQVVQQSPVTIVQAGHTELAMEKDLAGSIIVRVEV